MTDAMHDIETLGTQPGSVILSIGAVAFNVATGKLEGEPFYRVIDLVSSLQAGLTVDRATIAWWGKQKPAAQAVILEALAGGDGSLTDILTEFNTWLRQAEATSQAKVRLWGNGSDFDNVLMVAAYRAADIKPAWSPFLHRCFRTLKNLFPGREPVRQGVHHNALADAEHQARWALEILNARRSL